MAAARSAASRVDQPNVVAGLASKESRGLLGMVHDPSVGRVENSVLEDDRRSVMLSSNLAFLAGNPVNSEQVALGNDEVGLKKEARVVHDLLESHVAVAAMGHAEADQEQTEQNKTQSGHLFSL